MSYINTDDNQEISKLKYILEEADEEIENDEDQRPEAAPDQIDQNNYKTNNSTNRQTMTSFKGSEYDELKFLRRQVLDELTETEKSFVDCMSVILDDIRKAVIKAKVLSSGGKKSQLSVFESCLHSLWAVKSIHQRFLECLVSQLESKVLQDKICKPLLRLIEDFRQAHYEHCLSLQGSFEDLADLRDHNPNCSKLLDGMVDHGRVWPLEIMIARPLKRLTQYHLLFQKLLQYTPPDHEDYSDTKLAFELFLSIARQMDQLHGEMQSVYRLKVFEREMDFKHAISTDGRKKRIHKFHFQVFRDDASRYVIREDDFKVVVKSPSAGSQNKYIVLGGASCIRLFLTNDLLLIGKREPKKQKWYMFHEPIPIDNFEVVEMPSVPSPDAIDYWFMLKVGAGELYYLTCSADQYTSWMSIFKDLKRNINFSPESPISPATPNTARKMTRASTSFSRQSYTSEKTYQSSSLWAMEVSCKAYVWNTYAKPAPKWTKLGDSVLYGYLNDKKYPHPRLMLYQKPMTGRPLFVCEIVDNFELKLFENENDKCSLPMIYIPDEGRSLNEVFGDSPSSSPRVIMLKLSDDCSLDVLSDFVHGKSEDLDDITEEAQSEYTREFDDGETIPEDVEELDEQFESTEQQHESSSLADESVTTIVPQENIDKSVEINASEPASNEQLKDSLHESSYESTFEVLTATEEPTPEVKDVLEAVKVDDITYDEEELMKKIDNEQLNESECSHELSRSATPSVIRKFLSKSFSDALDRLLLKRAQNIYSEEQMSEYEDEYIRLDSSLTYYNDSDEEQKEPLIPKRVSSIENLKYADKSLTKKIVEDFLEATIDDVLKRIDANSRANNNSPSPSFVTAAESPLMNSVKEKKHHTEPNTVKLDLMHLLKCWHALLISKAESEDEKNSRNYELKVATERLSELLARELF